MARIAEAARRTPAGRGTSTADVVALSELLAAQTVAAECRYVAAKWGLRSRSRAANSLRGGHSSPGRIRPIAAADRPSVTLAGVPAGGLLVNVLPIIRPPCGCGPQEQSAINWNMGWVRADPRARSFFYRLRDAGPA